MLFIDFVPYWVLIDITRYHVKKKYAHRPTIGARVLKSLWFPAFSLKCAVKSKIDNMKHRYKFKSQNHYITDV